MVKISKEQVLSIIRALKDYQIFSKKEQDREIAEILKHYIICDMCPFKNTCYLEPVNFCFDIFFNIVKGVK